MSPTQLRIARGTLCSILHDYTNRHLQFVRLPWIRGFVNGFHRSPILQSSFYLFVFSALSFPPWSHFFCFSPSFSSALKSCHFIGTEAAHESGRLRNQFPCSDISGYRLVGNTVTNSATVSVELNSNSRPDSIVAAAVTTNSSKPLPQCHRSRRVSKVG